jgi:hypothetical protein
MRDGKRWALVLMAISYCTSGLPAPCLSEMDEELECKLAYFA